MKPPSQKAQDFGNWIANYAEKHGVAVLAIVWDRQADTGAVMVIEGGERSPADDTLGGFRRRVAHALLGQPDIEESIALAALERAAGYGGQTIAPMPRERERG